MYYCEECQREFKTAQAMAGHYQFKHGVRRAAGAALQQLGQQLVEHAPAACEQHAEQLTEQLGYILERLDELLAPAAEHAHESSCHECHQFAEQVYSQGRVDGIKECHEHYQAIPGVPELRDRWGVAQEVVSDIPLIKITRAEDPAADNGLINIVSTPEGELARAEVDRQIGAIISQNGNKNPG